MKKSFAAIALVAIAGMGLVASRSVADEKPAAAAAAGAVASVGQPAPAFNLSDQDGNTVSLESFRGKVVVLEWFNDECPFVKKFYGQGHMNKWASSYKDKGVVWLAINSTKSHDAAHNKKIAGEWKIDRPILSDQNGAVGKQYGAKTTPHMYVIDPAGKLVYAGAIDSNKSSDAADIDAATNYVAKALDEVLAGQAVTTTNTQSYGCSVKY